MNWSSHCSLSRRAVVVAVIAVTIVAAIVVVVTALVLRLLLLLLLLLFLLLPLAVPHLPPPPAAAAAPLLRVVSSLRIFRPSSAKPVAGADLSTLQRRYEDVARTAPEDLANSAAAVLECLLYVVADGRVGGGRLAGLLICCELGR
jgi:hypothetical protein